MGLLCRRSSRTLGGMDATLAGTEAALIGLAASAVLMNPLLWPLVEDFNVMAHEGGHAVTGALLGFPPADVELNPDATGATSFPRSLRGPRAVIIAASGYLGPSMFGLGAAKLIETGHVISVLWVATIFLALLLLLIRRSFGLVSVPFALALLGAIMRYAHDGLEEAVSYAITWLLLLSGVRVAIADGANAADAANLSTMTHLPRQLWALLWLAGTLLAVIIGGKWMVLRS
jgi:Peptidase M50B-like